MEPGTYKDRVLLENNPYSLVEGMILAGYAIGVHHAFIFIRRGYEIPAANLRNFFPVFERRQQRSPAPNYTWSLRVCGWEGKPDRVSGSPSLAMRP